MLGQGPSSPRACAVPALTTGSAARSKQHLEVVFAVLPAFELERGREGTRQPAIIPQRPWPGCVRAGPVSTPLHPLSTGGTQPSLQKGFLQDVTAAEGGGEALRGGLAEGEQPVQGCPTEGSAVSAPLKQGARQGQPSRALLFAEDTGPVGPGSLLRAGVRLEPYLSLCPIPRGLSV